MRYSHWILSAVLAAAGVPVATVAFAHGHEKGEKVVELKSLPDAARETILRELKGGKLLKVEEMTKDGKTLYEAHIQNGKDVEGVVVDAKGRVVDRHSEKSEKHEKHEKH
jgi:uncharacterized membrane protein YkoI